MPKLPTSRVCAMEGCTNTFTPKTAWARFCCPEHSEKTREKRRGKRIRTTRTKTFTCEVCGKTFKAKVSRRTCGKFLWCNELRIQHPEARARRREQLPEVRAVPHQPYASLWGGHAVELEYSGLDAVWIEEMESEGKKQQEKNNAKNESSGPQANPGH